MILSKLSKERLFQLWLDVVREMGRRGLSTNVGTIGESLAIKHFNSTPGLPTMKHSPAGTTNVDAMSKDGDRYSIKTLLKAKKTGTIYPDRKNRDKQLFEYLLLVRLNDDFSLRSIYRFSWAQFVEARSWDKRMNAWYLGSSTRVMSCGEELYAERTPASSR